MILCFGSCSFGSVLLFTVCAQVMAARVTSHPKIEMIWNSAPLEAKGDGKKLASLLLQNLKTKRKSEISLSGLFFAIGHKPNSDFVKGLLNLDSQGYIVTNQQRSGGFSYTSVAGVFAAGDGLSFSLF